MRAVIASLLLAGCATNCNCKADPHLTLQLPRDFSCRLENTEHVCVTAAKDRYVITSMKEKGSDDTLEIYRERFKGAKIIEINGAKWLDATRIEGEMPGYSTRYLATVDDQYAALVTFTATKAQFAQFNEDLKPVIAALILRR